MQILRQSTQVVVRIGPALAVGDGFTPVTSLTLSGADEAEALKAAGAATVDISGATFAAITGSDGWYNLTLTTGHTDTVGTLEVVIHDDSLILPIFARFQVVEEAIYDALFAAAATGLLPANVTQYGGVAGTFASGRPEVNASHWGGTAVGSANVRANVLQYNGVAGTFASGRPEVNTTHFGGTAGTFASGRPEVNTTHFGGTSVGAGLRALGVSAIGTAQAVDATSITLAAGFTPGDDTMIGKSVYLPATQISGLISDWVSATGVATVTWSGGVTPTGTPDYVIFATVAPEGVPQSVDIGTLLGTPNGETFAEDIAAIQAGVTSTVAAVGTPSDFGSGATLAANLVDIENQTDDIGAAGAGLTALPWNPAWDAQVQSEVQDAIEANHLDHLLAADYDPASKPGVATSLFNELIESDAGVSRFTANALEQAPAGGGGTSDWTADERTAIRTILGIPASGTTPEDPTDGILDDIRDAVGVVDGKADAILQDTAEIGTAGAGLTEAGGTGDQLTAIPWNSAWDAEVESELLDALRTQLQDSIPALGAMPTFEQALYMVTQLLVDRSVSGTTVSIKKPDGSTVLFTQTLDDATTPTSITRAT